MFSALVRKFNRNNKMAERAVVVTDTNIYKLDAKKFKCLTSHPIADVSSHRAVLAVCFCCPFKMQASAGDRRMICIGIVGGVLLFRLHNVA